MKIAHIAPSSHSKMSAAWRIRKSQEDAGHEALALAHSGERQDNTILFNQPNFLGCNLQNAYKRLDGLPLRFAHNQDKSLPWSSGWVGMKSSRLINELNPDIANFHWLTNGYFNLGDLSEIKCPIVLTMHDVWTITAGCHCNLDCNLWLSGCSNCPQLGELPFDFSNWLWARKLKIIQKLPDFTIVTPSKWLQAMAQESPILRGFEVRRIPNCLDQKIFCPGDKASIRNKLGIPLEKTVIAFGAVNAIETPYKGYKLLMDALWKLAEKAPYSYHLIIFGGVDNSKMPFPATFMGNLLDEDSVADVYKLSDLFVSPSQQDNFPSTLLEAASCGLPLVGFNIGGVPEIIRHKENGYVAHAFDIIELARGIEWVTESKGRMTELGNNSREYALKHYSPEAVAKQYLDLYSELMR